MKIGDLVRLPEDSYYWWGGKVGVIVGMEYDHADWPTLRLLVAAENECAGYAKFGANFVELISESR